MIFSIKILDFILSACSVFLIAPLINIIFNNFKTKHVGIKKIDSLFTCLPLSVMAFCFFDLGLYFNCACTTLTATSWLIIFIQNFIFSKKHDVYMNNLVQRQPILIEKCEIKKEED